MTDTATTTDAFYHGRLMIRQPAKGYRAGIDAMLLAAGVGALRFEHALDFGCGVGTAMLGAALLQPGGCLTGIEKDAASAGLAAANIADNGFADRVTVITDNALAPQAAVHGQFDLVFSNPPFFDDDKAMRRPAPERTDAWIAGVSLETWIKAMLKLATAKGSIVILHRADRLADILAVLPGRAGQATIYPIRPRADQPASRILVRARKGSRAPLMLLNGLDLHPRDPGEGRFTARMQAVLDGGWLPGWVDAPEP